MSAVATVHVGDEGAGTGALGPLLAALGPLLAWITSASAFAPVAAGDHLLGSGLRLIPAAAPGTPIASCRSRCARSAARPARAARGAGERAGAAFGAAVLYLAIDASLRAGGALPALLRSPLALASSWLAFGCAALFTGKPDAASAGVALGCLYVQQLAAFERAWPRLALRRLRQAGLAWSLLCVEQPALAAVLIVPALPSLTRLLRGYRLPAANLLPLVCFWPLVVFGVLRDATAHGALYAQAWPAALLAVFEPALRLPRVIREAVLLRELGPLLLLGLALAGALIALFRADLRRLSLLWLLATAAPLAGSACFVSSQVLAGLALCAAAGLGALGISRLIAPAAQSKVAVAVALCACALALVQLHSRSQQVRAGAPFASDVQAIAARAFGLPARPAPPHTGAPFAADAIADATRRDLPARAALLLGPGLGSRWIDGESEERVRPDLLAAEKPWRLDLSAAQRRAAQAPELQPLLRADVLRVDARRRSGTCAPSCRPRCSGAARNAMRALSPWLGVGLPEPDAAVANPPAVLPLVELQALAARRPLLLELEPLLELSAAEVLLPLGLYHQVATSPVSRTDLQLARRDHESRLQRLLSALPLAELDLPSWAVLLRQTAAEQAFAIAVDDRELRASSSERLATLLTP